MDAVEVRRAVEMPQVARGRSGIAVAKVGRRILESTNRASHSRSAVLSRQFEAS